MEIPIGSYSCIAVGAEKAKYMDFLMHVIKRFDMRLKACAYGKKGTVGLPHRFTRFSVRPFCVKDKYKKSYLIYVRGQRGTCLAEIPAKSGLSL